MSVLPNSASFASFFVVLTISFALTLLLGLNLPKLRTTIILGLQAPNPWVRIFFAPLSGIRNYVQIYVDELGGERPTPDFWMFCCNPFNIRTDFMAIMRNFLIPEISVPRTLWTRFLYRNSLYVRFHWSPVLLVVHVIRIMLIPVWITLFLVMICCLVLGDGISWVLFFLHYSSRYR